MGSKGGTVVIALASHQCGPGTNPRPGDISGLSLVVGSRPCPEGFSPGSPVFLPPQKSTFLNSSSIGNSRATGLSVVRLLSATLVKTKSILFFYFCGFKFLRCGVEESSPYPLPYFERKTDLSINFCH